MLHMKDDSDRITVTPKSVIPQKFKGRILFHRSKNLWPIALSIRTVVFTNEFAVFFQATNGNLKISFLIPRAKQKFLNGVSVTDQT